METITATIPEQIEKINHFFDLAVRAWEDYNNSGGEIPDVSDHFYGLAAKLAQQCANKYNMAVSLDLGVGLYPTFEIVNRATNRHYTEYNAEGFFKRITGFWG